MIKRHYSVGDLRKVIKESSENEFEPVYGKNVESDNKKINDKAYKDMTKAVKDYDGGQTAKSRKGQYPMDDNYGMENLQYNNMNDTFKERTNAQLKGYTSADAEKKHKNDDFGNANFNEYDGMKEKDAVLKDRKLTAKEIGLTSRELAKKDFENLTKGIQESRIKKLNFKNTTFLCESHMMTKIPDTFKVEGKRFIMNDRTNHEYLIEWHVEDDPKIIDKKRISEEQETIKRLTNYQPKKEISTAKKRINENERIGDMLNNMRKLMK